MRVARYTSLVLVLLIFTGKVAVGQEKVNSEDKTKKTLIKTSGSVGLGYEYGIIPFLQNQSVPSGYFKTDGNINIQYKSLPFTATFLYTNLKNVNGLNNYFRVSFDVQKYKSNLLERKNKLKDEYKQKLPSLSKEYQLLQQKIAYLNHVNSNLEHYYNLPDSSLITIPDSLPSIHLNTSLPPVDSSLWQAGFTDFKDSISQRKEELLGESVRIKNQIDQCQSIMQSLENPLPGISDTLIYMNPLEKFFSHVQRFEVGMCYPSYSSFLVSNIPVKGINFEYEKNKRFFAVTAGTTINNLLFTNNIIQNNLQNTQNLFNFFDFANPVSGRKLISAKAGWGAKTEDHLYVGALYATGMQSYYFDSAQAINNSSVQREHNVVIELDGKLKPKEWVELDFIYGKSSVKPLTDETDTLNTSLTQLFSPYRSHAFSGKAEFKMQKIKSSLSVSMRWVDPFFRSFGVGFMRSDNMRYEIRSNHHIGKKWKAGFFYRRDENNLLNLYSYQTILHSGGANVRFKLNRNFTFSALFNPVFQYSSDHSSGVVFANQNYIAGASAVHSYHTKKVSVLTNLTGNYYQLYNGSFNSEYINVSFSNSVTVNQFSSTFSASLFDVKGMDSLAGNTILLYNDVAWRSKKITFGGGMKLSLNDTWGQQLGYHARLEARIHKNISLEIRGEKMVLGDFYNSLSPVLFNSFPYLWSGRMTINW